MNYAYLRVSSQHQGKDNKVSIPEQRAAIEQRARADGRTIDVWLNDSKRYRSEAGRLVEPSGTRMDRPGFVQLLKAIRSRECERVYAWAQDRLGRGGAPIATLRDLVEKTGCEVVLLGGGWDNNTAELLGAVSGMEIRSSKRRFAMGRHGRWKEGLQHAMPPWGYTIIRNEAGDSVGYYLRPEARKLMKQIAKRFLAGESYYEIARTVPAPRGNPDIRPTSWLTGALRNPFYRGKVQLNGQLIIGKQEAVFDESTAHALDREITRRRNWWHSRPRRKKSVNLFAGLIRCAFCGGWMKTNNQTHRGINFYGYTCSRRATSRSHPPNNIAESILIAQVRELLEGDTEAFLAMTAGAITAPSVDEHLEELKQKASDLEQAKANVSGLASAMRVLETELMKVRAEIDATSAPNPEYVESLDRAARVAALNHLKSPRWWAGDREKLRDQLRSALRELWLKDRRIVEPRVIV